MLGCLLWLLIHEVVTAIFHENKVFLWLIRKHFRDHIISERFITIFGKDVVNQVCITAHFFFVEVYNVSIWAPQRFDIVFPL